ncbi:hypothetical protein RI065_01140 [Mycoplasmatota bacterium zrk1]
MKWQLFPKNLKPNLDIKNVVKVFEDNWKSFESRKYTLKSDLVLKILSNDLIILNYMVEKSKKKVDKISVPVLYGENGFIEKYFEADAYSREKKIVIEVEAGRAYLNNQFLKDVFQAALMDDVDYLVIACRMDYLGTNDYEKIYKFFDTMFISGKIHLDLKGILLIGY